MIQAGMKFNFLTAIGFSHRTRQGNYWVFLCDCGTKITALRNIIMSGKNKSCGCYKRSRIVVESTKHGDAKRGKRERLHSIWYNMIRRCGDTKNTRYADYGGRGIKVCDQWLVYLPFKEWALANSYNDSLTIERIDNEGMYEPNNCKWILFDLQGANKRNSRLLSFSGKTQHAAAWAKEYGIPYKTFHRRLQLGWGIEETLRTRINT
jgi:hypothetical protein